MGEHPVVRFRRVFSARLASGKYEPIDVVQAVKALATRAHVLDAFDVYCTLFDPARPPGSRASFELCRTTGFNLFGRALDLSDPQNGLAEMVRSVADSTADAKAAPLTDPALAKRVPVYRARYAVLDPKDRADIQRRVKLVFDDRAAKASRQRFLLDDLERAFQVSHGRLPKGDELASFDPGPATARKRFEQLAAACEAAWFPTHKRVPGMWVDGQFVTLPGGKPPPIQKSAIAATQHVGAAFAAFAEFVQTQIVHPVDFFRLLAWVSESEHRAAAAVSPSAATSAATSASGSAPSAHAGRSAAAAPTPRAWSGVWRELYQDVAVRGLYVALTRWGIDRMRQAHGYVGKDLTFVLAPLDAAGRALLTRRLADSEKAAKAFHIAQAGRRKAKVWGDVKGLEMVDELQSEAMLKEMIAQFEADPKGVLKRKLRIQSAHLVSQETCSIFGTIPGVFTITWIPKGTGMRVAYVEVHAIPGVVFKAWGDRVGLAELIEDKMYADLAANAAALAQFLLFYLQVLGYVVDVITAGASGGIRVIVLKFIEERIKDKIIAEGLELAGIDNPWVQTLAGLAAGFVPSAIRTPALPFAASVGPRVERAGDNVFMVEKASAAEVAAHAAKATGAVPPTPGALTRAKDYVAEVADRATDSVASPALAPAVAGRAEAGAAREAAGMLATRLPARGVAPGVGGAASRGTPPITQRALRAVNRLRKSRDYRLLEEYEDTLMASWEKTASAKARRDIVDALERSGGSAAAESDAIGSLRAALNKAKADAGEFNLTADLYSAFDVDDVVTIPTRGKGPPVIDVVVRFKKVSRLNGGKKFGFGEGKGGLNTGLGEVTPKKYFFLNGELRFTDLPGALPIRQASGGWYHQKFAEIYAMGQKLGGAQGKQMQKLANELFDAARKGEIVAIVGKSNVAFDRKFIDSTADVMAYFASQTWDLSKGFPIPK